MLKGGQVFCDVPPRAGTLAFRWAVALAGVRLRYPDPRAEIRLDLTCGDDPPTLKITAHNLYDTRTGAHRERMVISCIRLAIWPGEELCRMWLAAAWAGYLQHEGLELCTWRDREDVYQPPLDAHQAPYECNPFNRGLREGMPTVLDGSSLIKALATVMDEVSAGNLVRVYFSQMPELPPHLQQAELPFDLSSVDGGD